MTLLFVTPANARVQRTNTRSAEKEMKQSWTPAFAGMTGDEQ
jgi:hypothetical protein